MIVNIFFCSSLFIFAKYFALIDNRQFDLDILILSKNLPVLFCLNSGEQNFFTSGMIKDCMKKVVAVNLHQVVQVKDLQYEVFIMNHRFLSSFLQGFTWTFIDEHTQANVSNKRKPCSVHKY